MLRDQLATVIFPEAYLEGVRLWYEVSVALRVLLLQGIWWVLQPHRPQVLGV